MTRLDLRRVDEATVWKADRAAARLRRTAQGVQFGYLPDYGGPDVATTLPRNAAPAPRPAGSLPPFFTGLLPEGRRLSAIRTATKTSVDDELTLLLAVGGDTIGDVRIVPAGSSPDEDSPEPVPEQPAEIAFDELFASVLGPELRDRVALPGVQDKVSGRMISLPVSFRGAACILKLDPPEVPHLVANEAFFLRAARASGIDTADFTVVHDKNGKPGLLVRRFDREPTAGAAGRSFAQEDACQVLGRYPADKYLLTTEAVIQGLAQWTLAPVVAARALLRQFAFAYLTGNGDAHAKNFSIVRQRDEWVVTPAYDLPSSLPYGDVTMALSIQGKDRENLGRRDFLALGADCGVPPKATERVLDELLATMPSWLDRLEELPFDERQRHQMGKACRYRGKRLQG